MNYVKDFMVDLSGWLKDYTSVVNLDAVKMAQANLTLYDALGDRSWMKPLVHISYLVHYMKLPEPLLV